LKKTEKVNAVYRDEVNAHAPTPPCVGSVNEPHAEPGFVCFYRGGNFGSLESEDTNAAFFNFAQPEGGFQTTPTAKEGARSGEIILFRSTPFDEEPPETEVTENAYLSAFGSWSVTSK